MFSTTFFLATSISSTRQSSPLTLFMSGPRPFFKSKRLKTHLILVKIVSHHKPGPVEHRSIFFQVSSKNYPRWKTPSFRLTNFGFTQPLDFNRFWHFLFGFWHLKKQNENLQCNLEDLGNFLKTTRQISIFTIRWEPTKKRNDEPLGSIPFASRRMVQILNLSRDDFDQSLFRFDPFLKSLSELWIDNLFLPRNLAPGSKDSLFYQENN